MFELAQFLTALVINSVDQEDQLKVDIWSTLIANILNDFDNASGNVAQKMGTVNNKLFDYWKLFENSDTEIRDERALAAFEIASKMHQSNKFPHLDFGRQENLSQYGDFDGTNLKQFIIVGKPYGGIFAHIKATNKKQAMKNYGGSDKSFCVLTVAEFKTVFPNEKGYYVGCETLT